MDKKKIYYVYMYLRECLDPTKPYYVGKGKYNRAYDKDHACIVPPRSRIVFVKTNLSEKDAFDLETSLIKKFGRAKDGGWLCNVSLGGTGRSKKRTIWEHIKKLLQHLTF